MNEYILADISEFLKFIKKFGIFVTVNELTLINKHGSEIFGVETKDVSWMLWGVYSRDGFEEYHNNGTYWLYGGRIENENDLKRMITEVKSSDK